MSWASPPGIKVLRTMGHALPLTCEEEIRPFCSRAAGMKQQCGGVLQMPQGRGEGSEATSVAGPQNAFWRSLVWGPGTLGLPVPNWELGLLQCRICACGHFTFLLDTACCRQVFLGDRRRPTFFLRTRP